MKILLVPDAKLRQKARDLKKITQKEIEISKKMIELMLKAPGVGLAANQIGILKKIITINIPNEEKSTNKTYALFNPKIIHYSKKKIMMEEGCLSLPKQYAEIERSENIVVRYVNENNEVILRPQMFCCDKCNDELNNQNHIIKKCPHCGIKTIKPNECNFIYCQCRNFWCFLCGSRLFNDHNGHNVHYYLGNGSGPYGNTCRTLSNRKLPNGRGIRS